MTTMSAREFNQNVSVTKRQAAQGPVSITDSDEPAFMLLSIEGYRRLGEDGINVIDRLSMDDDIEFEPPRMELKVPEP